MVYNCSHRSVFFTPFVVGPKCEAQTVVFSMISLYSMHFLLSRFDGCSKRHSAENMVPVVLFVVPRFTL